MISSKEALTQTLKNTGNAYTLHGRIKSKISEASRRGEDETEFFLGQYNYSDEIVEKNIRLLKKEGFDLHLKNSFNLLVIKW